MILWMYEKKNINNNNNNNNNNNGNNNCQAESLVNCTLATIAFCNLNPRIY